MCIVKVNIEKKNNIFILNYLFFRFFFSLRPGRDFKYIFSSIKRANGEFKTIYLTLFRFYFDYTIYSTVRLGFEFEI